MNTLILGATKGLGKEIALECVNRGDNTIEVGSSAENACVDNRTFLNCDLSSTSSVASFVEKLSSLPPIDEFYWVAGRLLRGDFKDHSPEEITRTIDINFRNAIPVVHHIWLQMQQATTPCKMIMVSSSSGRKARTDEAIYAATKHAQVGFAHSLGLENQNENLKVCLVLPGGMKTQLWDHAPNDAYESFLDPNKVAKKILSFVSEQTDKYDELEIPRGSL